MTRALIADDEPHLAQYLLTQLNQLWPELEIVYVARNGVEAAVKIAELQPELAFLDIQMPGLNGLEVAQGIEGMTRVVFVTAFDAYAVEAFEHAALDYLLKPLKTERLAHTIARIQAALATPAPAEPDVPNDRLSEVLQRLLRAPPVQDVARLRFVRVTQGDLMQMIAVDDVLFFHADDKYTVVQTTTAEHLIRTPITELAQQLDPDQFWQVHRSTLVNLQHVAGTRRDETSRLFVRIKGRAQELAVSRAYVHLFKAT